MEKALAFNGPSYIQIFSSCPTGWKHTTDQSVNIAKLAFQTRVTPLYEIENGVLKMSMEVPKPRPIKDYLELQNRFKHLSEDEINQIQDHVNKNYDKLLSMAKSGIELF